MKTERLWDDDEEERKGKEGGEGEVGREGMSVVLNYCLSSGNVNANEAGPTYFGLWLPKTPDYGFLQK